MVKARFVLDMQKERKGKSFFVLNELPLHFLADIVGGEHKKSILIDKRTKGASIIKVVNDYLGNIPTSFRCQDGYFFNILDPISFREKIEEHINSGDCPPSQISKLTSLMETLDEDDNSILLLGKLKESK